jgi:ABC-type transport system involved in cytochrome c biogenesis permease subunit
MFPPLHITCFAASYGVALVLDVLGIVWRAPVRRYLMIGFAAAGVLAHTWYLGQRAAATSASPLASPYDWCLLAAWLLAVIYLAQAVYYKRLAIGVFLLPAVLALIGASLYAGKQPIAPEPASKIWGTLHGVFLLLGTVAVTVGFLSGVMYLVQSHRLKRKLPPAPGFRLPSLEWLERVNSRSLGASALMMGVGFVSGVILNTHKNRAVETYVPWTDPVVVSLGLMLLWLVVAELFRLTYPAARRGRKVAYLTVAAFVFLCFTLASLLLLDTQHGTDQQARAIKAPRKSDLLPPLPLDGGGVGGGGEARQYSPPHSPTAPILAAGADRRPAP